MYYFFNVRISFKWRVYDHVKIMKLKCVLKMLGLYLDTLIIGQTICNVLSILNELNFVTNDVFGAKITQHQ